MYWIYLFRQHNKQLVVMVFYNDMFRFTRVIVRFCSEPFDFSTLLLTVLEVVGRYEVAAILTLT
jgi:hypothetical protein